MSGTDALRRSANNLHEAAQRLVEHGKQIRRRAELDDIPPPPSVPRFRDYPVEARA